MRKNGAERSRFCVDGRKIRDACAGAQDSDKRAVRAVSSVGRAPALHAGCRRFESVTAHHPKKSSLLSLSFSPFFPHKLTACGKICTSIVRQQLAGSLTGEALAIGALRGVVRHLGSGPAKQRIEFRCGGGVLCCPGRRKLAQPMRRLLNTRG